MKKRDRPIDHTGQKFERLTAIKSVKNKGWKCECDCGNIVYRESYALKNNFAKSCGCIHSKNNNQFYKDKIYKVWQRNVVKKIMSDEFKDFLNFKKYFYENFELTENSEIHRIDKTKQFGRNNIIVKNRGHQKIICGIKYYFCSCCQRYILDIPKFYSKNKRSPCKICIYKTTIEREYNLEYKNYIKMLKENNGCCKICKTKLILYGKTKTSCIDHCHKTNTVRGILCQNCNSALGMFNDCLFLIYNSIQYLKRGDSGFKYNKSKRCVIDDICPITGYSNNLVCDHNHKTGYIRGNIYNYINLGIGLFKDSIENLENSIKYLEKEIK